jgi:hypothetical protein
MTGHIEKSQQRIINIIDHFFLNYKAAIKVHPKPINKHVGNLKIHS